MDGNNASFKSNASTYLGKSGNGIACYNVNMTELKQAVTRGGGNPDAANVGNLSMEFDIVPQKGGYKNLEILGPVGTYAGTSRKGSAIVANWIPYLGQKSSNDPAGFGYINLSDATEDYIFSAGLSGCNFVVVQQTNGDKWVYHEPTASSWPSAPAYGGTVLLRAGPTYSDTVHGGYAMVVRNGTTGWKILVQSVAGVAVQGVTEHVIP